MLRRFDLLPRCTTAIPAAGLQYRVSDGYLRDVARHGVIFFNDDGDSPWVQPGQVFWMNGQPFRIIRHMRNRLEVEQLVLPAFVATHWDRVTWCEVRTD